MPGDEETSAAAVDEETSGEKTSAAEYDKGKEQTIAVEDSDDPISEETPTSDVKNTEFENEEENPETAGETVSLGTVVVAAGTVSALAAEGTFPAGAVLCVSDAQSRQRMMFAAKNAALAVNSEEGDEYAGLVEIPGAGGLYALAKQEEVQDEYSVTSEVVASYRYEISMIGSDGEALQPPEGQSVTLAFNLPEAADVRRGPNMHGRRQ